MDSLQAPNLDEIERAAQVLAPILVRTPLVPLRGKGLAREPEILLKPEIHQPVGSFKIRGVFFAVASLDEQDRARGLLTVSAGNTAQALAWAGRHFGVAAHALMPESAPRTKIDAVRALGGQPRLVPTAEVFRFLEERSWTGEDLAFIHPWTDPRMIVGHGTLGLEIAADRPDIETVYVSVGGGGLIAGVAAALRARLPAIRIVAVEPAGCPALSEAFRAGQPVEVECQTICDGIAVPYITDEMYPLLRTLVDEVRLVEEPAIRDAIRSLALDNKVVVEPAGAITVAAALADPDRRGPAVCVLSGGSIDPELLAACLPSGQSSG